MRTVEVTDELQAYMDGLLRHAMPCWRAWRKRRVVRNIPIVGPHEGALLSLLIKIAGARRLLELGTATATAHLAAPRHERRGADDLRGDTNAPNAQRPTSPRQVSESR